MSVRGDGDVESQTLVLSVLGSELESGLGMRFGREESQRLFGSVCSRRLRLKVGLRDVMLFGKLLPMMCIDEMSVRAFTMDHAIPHFI